MVVRFSQLLSSIAVVALLVALLASPIDAQTPPSGLSVWDLDGQEHAFATLLDERRDELVVFATTWCGVCRRELPAVESWAADHADRVRTLYVFSGSDLERVAEIVERYGPTNAAVEILVDPDGRLAQRYGVTATPTLVHLNGSIEPTGVYTRVADVPEPAPHALARFSDSGRELGTTYDIVIVARPDDADRVAQDLRDARELVRQLEARFSEWRDDSEISRLNREAGSHPVTVSDDLRRMLLGALHVSTVTSGAFDPTFKPLQLLWDDAERRGELPSDEQLSDALGVVGIEHVRIDGAQVQFDDPHTRLGLEAVAKGWIVDAVFSFLVERGYRSVLVNIGGDLRTSGREANDERRVIRIVDPFSVDATAGLVTIEDTAVATSGNYFRSRRIGETEVGHIVDPRTGRPPTFNGSVTVLTPDAAMADALATALFVLGPEEGMRLVAGLEQVGVIFVTEDGIVANVPVEE